MDEPRIRQAELEDRAAILTLLCGHLGYGDAAGAEMLWRWKHENNPFGRSACLIAEAGNEVVGVRSFMRWRWRAGSQELPAVRAVDTATHSAWRRRGLFSRLTSKLLQEMRLEGCRFIFNTPNRQSRPGYLKLGWTDVARVPLLLRAKEPLRMARALLWRNADPGGLPLLPGFPTVDRLLAQPGLSEFLALKQAHEARLQTPQSIDYLRWRYQEAPGFDYRAVWSFEASEGAAVVFRLRLRNGLREAALSEVLASPGIAGKEAARDLLIRLAESVPADYLIACAATQSSSRDALRASGFLPLPGLGPRLLVHSLSQMSGSVDPGLWSSWGCSLGDLEVF